MLKRCEIKRDKTVDCEISGELKYKYIKNDEEFYIYEKGNIKVWDDRKREYKKKIILKQQMITLLVSYTWMDT